MRRKEFMFNDGDGGGGSAEQGLGAVLTGYLEKSLE